MDIGTVSGLRGVGDSGAICGLAGLGGLTNRGLGGLTIRGVGGGGFTSGSTLRRTCKGSSGAGGFGLTHHDGNKLACRASDKASATRNPRRDRSGVPIISTSG